MTEKEAFEAWAESAGYRPDYLRPSDGEVRDGIRDVQEAWIAALAWLRSQGKPAAWMIPGTLTSDRGLAIANGRNAVPLYAAPQLAIPDGWKLVPGESTPEMWSAGVSAFTAYATRYEMAKTAGEGCCIADVAPDKIYRAMLAAAPEPKP